MQKYLLRFWTDHKDVLLDCKMIPLHPESNYSTVIAVTSKKFLAIAYSSPVINIPETTCKEIILVNGTYDRRLILETVSELFFLNESGSNTLYLFLFFSFIHTMAMRIGIQRERSYHI